MAGHMFGDVVEPSITVGTQKWYTIPLSIFVHTMVVAAMVIIPLMAADVLPTPQSMMAFVAAPPPPPPPPPPAPPPEEAPPPPEVDVNPAAAPVEAPQAIVPEPDTSFDRAAVGAVPGGIVGGMVGGPPPPPPPPPPPTEPVRVGGAISPPVKTRDVSPVYPSIAQSARVQGVVIIEATIGADGRVQNTRVLRSIPLLDNAALEAVRQWEFTPTLLNGSPVPVIMTVTVNFQLS